MFLLLLTAAHAAGWADFGAAFPAFPCQDGWMSCLVGGAAVGPEPSGAEATPSDLRISFRDLDATASFSPFVTFPIYPEPEIVPVAAPVVAVVAVAPTSPIAPVRPLPPKPGPTPGIAVDPPVKVVDPPVKVVDPPPAPLPVPSAGCDDVKRLEPLAMLGKLDAPTLACLEAGATTGALTSRDRYSRVLLADAWGKGDRAAWSRLAKRHLDEIDASDAEMSYKFALQLQRDGKHEPTIVWSERSLERAVQWTGDTYVDRVSALHKLRAMAAQALWKQAEEKAVAAPSSEASAAADKARARTKVFAREWYEYTASAGRDATKALQLCVAAAGTADYCKGS